MHKIAASVTVVALAMLTLAGCAAADGSDCVPVAPASDQTRALVTATGEQGTAPEVQAFTPLRVDEAVSWQTLEGDGTPLTTADQVFGADLELLNGTTGESLYKSEYGESASQLLTGTSLDTLLPGAGALMECAEPGSRVVFLMPGTGLPEQTLTNFQLSATDSLVGVVDVRDVYLARADGVNEFHTGTGLPSVVRAPDGQTGVVIPDAHAPASEVVQVVKRGDGATVEADSVVLVQYTAVEWDSRELVTSTWDTSPQTVTPAEGTQPFAAQLEGHTVGSQMMIVIPAAEGESADATVYVVDILGIAATATP